MLIIDYSISTELFSRFGVSVMFCKVILRPVNGNTEINEGSKVANEHKGTWRLCCRHAIFSLMYFIFPGGVD